jgi:HD superfamily phosphohydrolase
MEHPDSSRQANPTESSATDSRPQRTERKQELFLPIHGHVELYAEELAIIDHPSFQRLRRVRQLGMAHMVFPGATHTRFEHCVGAVHVAQLIVDHVNNNYTNGANESKRWEMIHIDDSPARFIRLGALLHDIGHLPFGHTLEDELHHLRSHDGPERLERVARIPYPSHEVDQKIVPQSEKPAGGWTLKALVNKLYGPHVTGLDPRGYDAFTVLSHIVCKAPRQDPEKTKWDNVAASLKMQVILQVCRDIVGNTICADFLDYLYRDWYHIGKPLYFDMRLYQYMEVRRQVAPGADTTPRFVINVRGSERIRHDALTDILTLLNARYKLAETVLFHRTKLALTGLLDRCLLEIADLYEKAGLAGEKLGDAAEELLLDASDDALPLLLKELAEGGDSSGREILKEAIRRETEGIQAATAAQASFVEGTSRGALGSQQDLILRLIDRLRDRDVYRLAYKLRMADFTSPHTPSNLRLQELLHIYKEPRNRLKFLRMLEAQCELQAGTLIMNCPPDPRMNAKVAEVNLYVEDDVRAFNEYEGQSGDSGLTHGALSAQINRFYELWAANIYVDRRIWDQLREGEKKNLKAVLKALFFVASGDDPKVVRAQMEPLLAVLRKKASRAGTTNPDTAVYSGLDFPSGVPFENPESE